MKGFKSIFLGQKTFDFFNEQKGVVYIVTVDFWFDKETLNCLLFKKARAIIREIRSRRRAYADATNLGEEGSIVTFESRLGCAKH